MSIDWRSAYRAAIRERDQTKLFPLCDRARRAMRERMSELGTQRSDVRESAQLYKSHKRLDVHATKHLMIAALSKEDRKSVRRRIQGTLSTLQQCEVYLRDYGAGNQNVSKLFCLVHYAQKSLTETQSDLAEKHKFTNSPKS